ncbi:MAG: amidohydrolase [Spirochaetales bacterium]|nr:amidohydrolase [Spirochaetales bacterium]
MRISTQQVSDLAKSSTTKTVQRRRHMHRYPELSFQEVQTSSWIGKELEALGIPYLAARGNYGLRAILDRGPGPIIALRADFDALPIQELNEVDFASTYPGVMHACGHDVHTSVLLTALEVLASLPGWSGKVIGIFQPGEEVNPGGAKTLIKEGFLENPRPGIILGEHINPQLEAGTVGFRPGLMMASADEINITIRGKGGHAASPHLTIDPIAIAAQTLVSLQQVVSRAANPETPSVLSFGKILGNGAMNVIPDTVEIAGTFRTVDESWRADALARISRLVTETARAFGAEADCRIDTGGYPVVRNDMDLTQRAKEGAIEYLGEQKVIDLPLVMWAEDFAYYAQVIPGCFYNLGVGNASRGWTSSLHSPTLMIDEVSLETGVGTMVWLTLRELGAT